MERVYIKAERKLNRKWYSLFWVVGIKSVVVPMQKVNYLTVFTYSDNNACYTSANFYFSAKLQS
ncbi:hypothetical protein A9Q98_11145 [Thalassotalea sp. 42_200_T64]|nr:hypothetical protein A9Q98_11145 [Thalassotalea sp. 42_200_T64]